MSDFHFENIMIGERHELGKEVLTTAAIKKFAAKYDPQYFHLDEKAASDSLFGALCASGWHVCALWMSKLVPYRAEAIFTAPNPMEALAAQGPSPGVENIRWFKPAFAGDTLNFYSTIIEKEDWHKPDWGLVKTQAEIINQHGETICSFIGKGLIRKLPNEE